MTSIMSTTMTTTKGIAAAAAVTLLAGLGTAVGATSSQAQTNAHTPATASKAAGFEVTAKVSNAEPEQGDRIKIRGSVKPARPGSEVVLQKRYGTTGGARSPRCRRWPRTAPGRPAR
jgi:hypothetical protein